MSEPTEEEMRVHVELMRELIRRIDPQLAALIATWALRYLMDCTKAWCAVTEKVWFGTASTKH
jgi:hypothetical protein